MREWESARAVPDRLRMEVPGLDSRSTQFLAREAVTIARRLAPRLSGSGYRGMTPFWGDGYYGIHWRHRYIWFQEAGIRPFTMRSLAGKTIPMWIDDPMGRERERNPNAQVRRTEDGRMQVLIFRKAAPMGSRKTVMREGRPVDVPRSYPGAPGRISLREQRRPWTAPGRVGGRIARTNIGVRWRHPGLPRRSFLRQGLILAAEYHGVTPGPIRDNFGRYR